MFVNILNNREGEPKRGHLSISCVVKPEKKSRKSVNKGINAVLHLSSWSDYEYRVRQNATLFPVARHGKQALRQAVYTDNPKMCLCYSPAESLWPLVQRASDERR